MARSRKQSPSAAPRARTTHSRQRQRLIDACISALHLYGPSRTTVEKVVAIAKMSPGIVRFYFASKAAMLVASLQFLAAEFEQQLMVPVSRLKSRPVEALELLVELYIDPEIATPRKVSVWYSFWGEASSRQEYYDICGQKDASFAVLVRDLIERLINDTGQAHLDADGVALGLIGVLEILWQDFAFQNEADIDRSAAKRRAMAYLRSVFPGQFASAQAGRKGVPVFGAWALDNTRLAALERSNIFQHAWQLIGLRGELRERGDYLSQDLQIERALLVRDESGEVHALRNSCPLAPHVLVPSGSGRLESIGCAVHNLRFDMAGRSIGGQGPDLTPLELLPHDRLLLVRAPAVRAEEGQDAWRVPLPPDACRLDVRDTLVAADWKVVAEALLVEAEAGVEECSGRLYASLAGSPASLRVTHVFPNHWISSGPDGFSVLQLLPLGSARSVIRRHRFSGLGQAATSRAARYLGERVARLGRPGAQHLAESIQRGAMTFGYPSAVQLPAAIEAFRRDLIRRLPLLAQERAPGEN